MHIVALQVAELHCKCKCIFHAVCRQVSSQTDSAGVWNDICLVDLLLEHGLVRLQQVESAVSCQVPVQQHALRFKCGSAD